MINTLLLLLMPAAFALNPVVGRALTGSYEPAQLTFVRWLAAGLLVGGLAYWRNELKRECPRGDEWWSIIGLGALGMGFCSYCAYAGSQVGTATNVSLIYASTTAFVVLYEILSRQARPGLVLISGVALCMAGAVAIITRGELARLAAIQPAIGDLWAIAGMTGWAIYTIAMKREISRLGPLTLFAVMSVVGALAAAPLAGVETALTGAPALDWHAFAWIAALVLFSSVGSYLSYNVAIRRAGPILTSAALSLSPLYTALMAMVLIGEELHWYHAAGGALVVLGLGTINFSRSRA